MIIAQYKFDNIIADLIPTFNEGFTYTYEDIIEGNTTTRIINSEELPTSISFEGGLALLALEFLEIGGLTSLKKMFYGCNNVTHINTDNWNTSGITDISDMFFYCIKLTILNLTHWDVSNVTTMAGLFNGCKDLISVKLNNWDLSSCNQIQYMFYGCESLEEIDLSNWDVSHITSVNSLFYNCKQLSILNLTGWSLDSIELTENMFVNCSDLITIIMTDSDPDTINYVLSEIPSDDYTEAGAINIIALNVDTNQISVPSDLVESVTINQFTVLAKYKFNKNIDTVPVINNNASFEYVLDDIDNGDDTITRTVKTSSNIIITSLSFKDCTGLLEIYELNMTDLTTAFEMFSGCSSLTSIAIDKWLITNITNSDYMFYNCTSLQSIDLTKWYNDKIQSMAYMFYNCNNLTSLDVSNFDTSNVTNMRWMFAGCDQLTSLDVSNWDTSKVTNMVCMFDSCLELTSLDVSNWDTSNVTDMGFMFYGCYNLTSLDVSNFDTSNVTNMFAMFNDCKKITTIKGIESLNVKKVVNFAKMFDSCLELTSLDLSNWDTSNVTDIGGMFSDDNYTSLMKLKTLNLSNWKFKENIVMTNLFLNSINLDEITMNNSDYNSVNKVISQLPTRTEENPGVLDIQRVDNFSLIDLELAKSKYWNIYNKVNCKPKFISTNKKPGRIKHCKGRVCIITTYEIKI